MEIWQLAREVSIEIHELSLKLPKHELYETGSQIRRSSKGVRSAIVEGYGRSNYKQDYIKFLIYALASNDETIDHLETLFETKSYTDEATYKVLLEKLNLLGKKINNFVRAVERQHISPK